MGGGWSQLAVVQDPVGPPLDHGPGFYQKLGMPDDLEGYVPIVYHPSYNITLAGVENFHPFDSKKYRRIVGDLKEAGWVNSRDRRCIEPKLLTLEHLTEVHDLDYLRSMSTELSKIIEFPPVASLPLCVTSSVLLKPMLMAVSGTILAAKVAMEKGWSVNVGGGMHHASYNAGGGWCAFSDITLAIYHARKAIGGFKKAAIVDLDAHQGNGHEHDKIKFKDDDTYIFDLYNKNNYPYDVPAKKAINDDGGMKAHTSDEAYLERVRQGMERVVAWAPQLVVYNAGTDILKGDPLGALDVTEDGVVERDRIVFEACQAASIPIMMVLSGGYSKPGSALVTARSLKAICEAKFS